ITFTVVPQSEGTLTNTATLTANEPELDPADNSATILVTVTPASTGPPVIASQPASIERTAAQSAAFAIAATGPGPLRYQWRKDGLPLSNTGPISGATSNLLTISPTTCADAATYDVVV